MLSSQTATSIVRVESADHQPLALLLEHEVVIGRDCEGLSVRDPQVSRRHLRLRPGHAGVEVSDLNSTNGSFLNGMALTSSQLLTTHSRLLIGDTLVTIEFPEQGDQHHPSPRGTRVRPVDSLRSTSIERVAESVSASQSSVASESLIGDTITIVFSDIEASTERATEMGDAAWFELLEVHNRIVRSELHTFGGREVKSIGDGFMLVFPSVRRGLRFATSVQNEVESNDGPDLRIRIGLHTGEAIEDAAGDLFGRHINLAARVANLARGGQILASLVVREIASGRDDSEFGPPRQVELKGFTELQTVYEALWTNPPG